MDETIKNKLIKDFEEMSVEEYNALHQEAKERCKSFYEGIGYFNQIGEQQNDSIKRKTN